MVNKRVLKVVTALFLSTVFCASCGKDPENVDNEPESKENVETAEAAEEKAEVLERKRVVIPNDPVEVTGLNDEIRPYSILVANNSLVFTDTHFKSVWKFAGDKVESLAGGSGVEIIYGVPESDYEDGDVKKALFSSPKGILVYGGDIYVADTVNGAVRLIRDGEVTTVIKGTDGTIEGYPISPTGLCILKEKMYVCDNFNGKIYVFDLK